MNLEDVISVCGPLSQAPQNMTNSKNKSNAFQFVALLAIGVIGYLLYREWQRKKEMEKNNPVYRTQINSNDFQ